MIRMKEGRTHSGVRNDKAHAGKTCLPQDIDIKFGKRNGHHQR